MPSASISVHRFSYGKHPSQFGDLRLPKTTEASLPVIISIHGGFWQAQYDLHLHDALAEYLSHRGYATWNIEYRRVGEDGGGWPGTFRDVISGINHLTDLAKDYPLDLDSVITLGHSAGGHLAVWAVSMTGDTNTTDNAVGGAKAIGYAKATVPPTGTGTHNATGEEPPLPDFSPKLPLRGAVSLAGVMDLRHMREVHLPKGRNHLVESIVGGSPEDVPDRYLMASPIERLPCKIPIALVHGDEDLHVPVEQSIEYYRQATEAGDKVILSVLPGVEHFAVIDPTSDAFASVVDVITALRASR